MDRYWNRDPRFRGDDPWRDEERRWAEQRERSYMDDVEAYYRSGERPGYGRNDPGEREPFDRDRFRAGHGFRRDRPMGYRRDYEDPWGDLRSGREFDRDPRFRTDYAPPRPDDYDSPSRMRDPRELGYDPDRRPGERGRRAPVSGREGYGFRSDRGIRHYDDTWDRGPRFGDETEGYDAGRGTHHGGNRTDRTHDSDYDEYRYGSGRWGGGRNW